MKLIGIKRVILLAILAGINAAIAAAYFLWISPMLSDTQAALAGVTGEISSLQTKIQNTKAELADYNTNLPRYNELKSRGFMSSQDRFQISRDLDAVRQAAKLSGFSFSVGDLQNLENKEATDAQLKVLDSRITLDGVGSLLDTNLYDFADAMQNAFPAHVRLQKFEIRRKDQLNPTQLLRISRNDKVELLTSNSSFDWITVVPAAPPVDPNNPNAPRP